MVKLVHFTNRKTIVPQKNNVYGGMLFFRFDEIANDIDKISFEFRRKPVFYEIDPHFLFEFQKIRGGYTEYIVYNEDLTKIRRTNERNNG